MTRDTLASPFSPPASCQPVHHRNAEPASRHRIATACAALALGLTLPPAAHAADADPTVEAQYRQGLLLRETGRPYSAIETLESLLAANPGLNRARLELAVAYYRTLGFARARAEAQKVLDDPTTPEAVRLSVQSFLKKIDLEEAALFGKPHVFEPSVSLGLMFDSNVNAGPDNALLPGGFVLQSAGLKQSDSALIEQAGLTHTWMRPTPVRIGETAARLNWVTQGNLYHRGYFDLHAYNLTVATLSTGPGLLLQNGDRTSLNLQLDHITFGGAYLGLYTSLSPSYTMRVGPGELTFDALWSQHRFHREVDDGRDSTERAVGLSYGHLLAGGRVAAQAGVRMFSESAQADRFSNRGLEAFAGARWRAWEGGDVFGRAAVRRVRYGGIEPIYGEGRRETERRLEVGASHRFDAGWLDRWMLSGTLAYVNNGANLSLYDYDRSTATVTLGRSF